MSERPFAKVVSWEDYESPRPLYPASLWKLILQHHDGALKSIHDVGAAKGIATDGLLTYQAIGDVYVSDPAEGSITTAREVLPARHPKSTFHFQVASAEQPWLQDGSVDLVVSCEAFHWVDSDAALPLIHASLRPGGTLALVLYTMAVSIGNEEQANEAIHSIMSSVAGNMARKRMGEGNPLWIRGYQRIATGLDWVELPAGQWKDVRRIEMNTVKSGGREWPTGASVTDVVGKAATHLEPSVVKENWDDPSWVRTETVAWLRQLVSYHGVAASDELWTSAEWKIIEDAGERAGGKLDFSYPVAVLLARKK